MSILDNLSLVPKDETEEIEPPTETRLQQKELSAFSLDQFELQPKEDEDDEQQESVSAPSKPHKNLDAFNLDQFSLAPKATSEDDDGDGDGDSKNQASTTSNNDDSGLSYNRSVDKSARNINAFNTSQFALAEKEQSKKDDESDSDNKADETPAYDGPENREGARREADERRQMIRFGKDERRSEQDRRVENTSPWTDKHSKF